VEITDAGGRVHRFEQDANGQVVRSERADGTQITYSYDSLGNMISSTSPNGLTTSYEYDYQGNLLKLIDPGGNTTQLEYDEQGHLSGLIEAEGQRTAFHTDAYGRNTRIVLPLGQEKDFTYTPDGLVETVTDFNRDTTLFEYDPVTRLLDRKVFADGSEELYQWDQDGQLRSVTSASGTVFIDLEQGTDRVSRVTYPDGTFVAYEYNQRGKQTRLTTPNQDLFFTYDARDRLEAVSDSSGQEYRYRYDDLGRVSELHYANGVVATYEYDLLDRIISVEHADANGTAIDAVSYERDLDGRIVRMGELSGRLVEYEYDPAGRLAAETRTEPGGQSDTITYTYDRCGNRLSLSHSATSEVVTFEYDLNNRLTRKSSNLHGTTDYSYDDNGSLLSEISGSRTVAYEYSLQERLARASLTTDGVTSVVEYEYDTMGRLMARVVDGQRTRMVFDYASAEYRPIELSSPGGSETFVFGEGPMATTSNGLTYQYLDDGRHTIRKLVDDSGAVVDSYAYDAFGNPLSAGFNTTNNILYRSQLYDRDTGLYYNLFRHYDPTDGRFVSRDLDFTSPSHPADFNRYLYAAADPVNHLDPYGLMSLPEVGTCLTIIGILLAIPDVIAFIQDPTAVNFVLLAINFIPFGKIFGPAIKAMRAWVKFAKESFKAGKGVSWFFTKMRTLFKLKPHRYGAIFEGYVVFKARFFGLGNRLKGKIMKGNFNKRNGIDAIMVKNGRPQILELTVAKKKCLKRAAKTLDGQLSDLWVADRWYQLLIRDGKRNALKALGVADEFLDAGSFANMVKILRGKNPLPAKLRTLLNKMEKYVIYPNGHKVYSVPKGVQHITL
jgi:RHS repeat-associated protein